MDSIPSYQANPAPRPSIVSTASQKDLSCQQFLDILVDLQKANDLLAAEQYQKAIRLLDKNIMILGQHYLSPTMIVSDDTGTKLLLGKTEQAKGHWKTAAYLKRNVLESRVSLFQKIKKCQPQHKS